MGARCGKADSHGLSATWGIARCAGCGGTIVLGETVWRGLCAECAAERAAAPAPALRVVYAESVEVTRFAESRAQSAASGRLVRRDAA